MITYGFTGTRKGMTNNQKAGLRSLLEDRTGTLVHGDCKGADEQAHQIAIELGWEIILWPADHPDRAGCVGTFTHPPLPPLIRNVEIVKGCDVLIAAPHECIEVIRSGTWTTIRRGIEVCKPIIMLWPVG